MDLYSSALLQCIVASVLRFIGGECTICDGHITFMDIFGIAIYKNTFIIFVGERTFVYDQIYRGLIIHVIVTASLRL